MKNYSFKKSADRTFFLWLTMPFYGAFEILITDAYQRRCAITGEKTLPVLEAVHIKPFILNGTHEIGNGLLIRRDFHTLFDRGYIMAVKHFSLPSYNVQGKGRICMEKYVFTAYISKDVAAGRFRVSFPDFPDCSTEGESFPEAYVAAWTALGLHLLDLLKNKKPIPEYPDFSDSRKRAEVPVEVDMLEIRRIFDSEFIGKSLQIPRWLDSLAKAKKINFSRTLEEALKEKLGIKD